MKKYILAFFIFSVLLSSYSYTWEKLYSIEGQCEISFPNKAHHMKQVVPIKDLNAFMNYDVYMSFIDDENSICMMIVVDFPSEIDKTKEKQSLEGFINGVLNYKEEKKLLYANFSEFDGYNALNFLLENDNRFFKGKAIIADSRLYLIAMEYNCNLDLDQTYNKYIKSFSLKS